MNGTDSPPPAPAWSQAVDDVLGGDLVIALAHTTPADGVVLTPVTNFALRDRERGTVTVLSSLGAWRKLRRIQQAPRVALAFHTRDHGYSRRPEYVLVQGTASFSAEPDLGWLESIEPNWERFMGPRRLGPVWDRWLRVYHWERIAIEVAVHRVTSWPDLDCRGEPTAVGSPRPAKQAPAQNPPAGGRGPRVAPRRAAHRARRAAHSLLGWVDDGRFPVVVPVALGEPTPAGLALDAAPGLVPPGARRAGLTCHSFTARALGQTQELFTGWLSSDYAGRLLYAPHTRRGYRLPPSRLLYRLLVGGFARLGLRQARRAGFLPEPSSPPAGISTRS